VSIEGINASGIKEGVGSWSTFFTSDHPKVPANQVSYDLVLRSISGWLHNNQESRGWHQ
jgi:hypothetical protein